MKSPHPSLLSALAVIAVIAALFLPGAAVAAPPAARLAIPASAALALAGTGQNPACPAVTAGRAATAAGDNLWQPVAAKAQTASATAQLAVNPVYFGAYTLDREGMAALLTTAPRADGQGASAGNLALSLPDPCGQFVSFAVQESPIMEPGLAAKHPDIKTYRGRGIDDPAATIRFDLTPLGFHASVRSPGGAWYLEPYYHLDDSVYASYYGSDLKEDPHGGFAERDAESAELSIDHGYYHASDTVTIHGGGFTASTAITVTISDPAEVFPTRTLSVASDEAGFFDAEFVADPDGILETHIVDASDGNASAYTSYQVVRDDDPTTDPPTGDVLRTYRLALITDPGYATFWGGPANVTPAKVTLINRVDQLYEDDMSIRLVLVANNDLLNLDTWGLATAPNGPCGAAACFTQSQVTGCSSTSRARYVVGQIIGASNYDIGHLGLGQPGGGVANLGVVGRSNKAGGCTGIPTPTGDYYAVDYVAHEMGHQFSGNHPFNGNQLNCSSSNRNASTSTEPGSGSSVMAYAGICLTDDLQAHSDPYFSQRSQQEITTYTSSSQAAINEVQTASLEHFGGGNEVQVVTFGPGYSSAATIQPLTVSIGGAPSTTQVGGAQEAGNTVTIATGATGSTHTLQVGDVVTISGVAASGYNGTWTVTAVPTSRSFQYTNPVSGLPISGGGTITLVAPGATESGTTVTINTAAAHGRSVGDIVTVASVGVSGYNGTFAITAVPAPRSFQYTAAASGLAASGGGTATFYSPFQVRIGGNDSAVIGGSSQAYSAANIQSAINAISGFAGSVTVSGASSTGFTVTYAGSSAGLDVPSMEIVNLSCSGCFASVEETTHGGAADSFTLNYDGNVSAPITNGSNYTSAGIQAALQGASEVQTVSLSSFDANGDSYTLNYDGADSVPITRGQNNTTAGIAAALQGGNEQQAITFTNFNAANAGNSYQVSIGGNLSAVLGNGGTSISNSNVAAAINAIPGFAGTVSVSGASNTAGPTITFAGASANTDVPPVTIVFGACASAGTPCTATNRENVKGAPAVVGWPAGGTVSAGSLADSGYTLTFGGNFQGTDVSLVSVTNASGCSGSSVETTKGSAGILPVGATGTVAPFGGGSGNPNNTGFQVTFGGSFATTNVPVLLAVQDFSAGASGWVGETDKGGTVDNTGGTVTPTGDSVPVVTVPAGYTIPLRTPFALTGSATDADDDPLIYSWEQNDRGASSGTALLNNTKTDGPLFAMFPKSGQISTSDSLQYNSPGENHLTASPTRVFPDLQQILDNNTNADTGVCSVWPIAPPVPQAVTECFAEFLPTTAYVGYSGVNASPLSLHFRLTARDGRGGTSSADTTLLLASGAGPFLVTSPNTAASYAGNSVQTVTWDPANTNAAPVNTTEVKIALSTDGGHTYPYVLAETTANDGAEAVTLPNVGTTQARVKIEAVGNIFFDVSNANFTVVPGEVWVDAAWAGAPAGTELAPGKIFGSTAFAAIQDGVNAVADGGTVNVAAGTYMEQVMVGKALTLKGANAGVAGATVRGPESVIDANLASAAVTFGADGIVVDGFTIRKGGGDLEAGIYAPATSSGYAIRNNIITDNVMGIYANSDAAATIENNLFDGNNRDGSAGGSGIYSEATQGLTVQGNKFTNHTVNNPVIFGATAAGAHQDLVFKDNVLDNSFGPYVLSVVNGRFEGNTFHSTAATGFSLADGSNGVDFVNNDFSGNARGLRIRNDGYGFGTPANVTAHGNNFANNPTYGLEVMAGAYAGDLNAEGNWWGSACGPAGTGPGTGSPVSANVDYDPWWAQAGGSALVNAGPGGVLAIGTGATAAEAQAVLSCAGTGQTVEFGGDAIPGGYTVSTSGVTISLNGSTVGHGSPAFTITASDVTIEGPGVIDGAASSDPGILVAAGANNFTLKNVEVKNWSDGVRLAGNVVSLKVADNWIHDNSGNGLNVQSGVQVDGVVSIAGNLFKNNGGAGIANSGATANLKAQYNSWGDRLGPAGPQGDGISGSVDASNFTFVEPFLDMDPDTSAVSRSVLQSQSFDVKLKVDAARLYGLTFKVTYDTAYLTLNSTTFASPWDGRCVALSATAGVVAYRCQLLVPDLPQDVLGATVATFNFTALPGSGGGPWATDLDISHLASDTSGAAAGGARIYVNNAGYGAPSVPARDITDTADGQVSITAIAQYTGFVDLQGRTNDSGATVQVFAQALKAGAVQYAGATSAAGGAYTTAYNAPNLLALGSSYWLVIDRPLYLPTTAAAATSYANSKLLGGLPFTTLGTVVLLGGDATDDNLVDVLDAACIGGAYALAPTTCGGYGSTDVNGDGVVDILDLSLMGGNYDKDASPWAP